MIKNNEDAIKHTAEIIHKNYTGEITDDQAKVQFFGVAVYNKLLKYRMDIAKLEGKSLNQIEQEYSNKEEKRSIKRIN